MKPGPSAINRALMIAKQIGERIDPGFGDVEFPKVGGGVPLMRADGGRNDAPDYTRPDGMMNMYSKAAVIASQLPMQRASPAEWRGALLNRGVKPAEIKWSEFENRYPGNEPISREDVASHFHRFQPDLYETDLRGDDTKYEHWTMPGGARYREVLLHEPDPREVRHQHAHWTEIGGNDNPWDDEDEAQDIPNVYVHARLKDRKTPSGGKVLHVEELQSDWGQEGRKKSDGTGGFRDPDPKKVLQDTEAQERHSNYVQDLLQRTGYDSDPASPMRNAHEAAQKAGELETLLEHGRAMLDERKANIRRMNAPIEGPYVGSTNDWVDLGLKHLLSTAAAKDHEHLAWTPGQIQAEHYPEDDEGKKTARLKGMQKFYDDILPKRLLKLARMHDPDAQLSNVGVLTRGAHEGPHFENTYENLPSLKITPKMRESILKHGFPAYAEGGAVDRHGYASDGAVGDDDGDEGHPLTNPVYHGIKGETVSTEKPAAMGMEMFNAAHPGKEIYSEPNRIALALGPHVSRDPNIAGDSRFTTGEKYVQGRRVPEGAQEKGRVMMLNTLPDEKFLPVPQRFHPDGSPRMGDSDDLAVHYAVLGDVLRNNPAIAREVMELRGHDPETASKYAEKFATGKPFEDPWVEGGYPYNSVEDYLRTTHFFKPGPRILNKIVRDFRKRMRDRGYAGLSYINTDADETSKQADPTQQVEDKKCYIVFPQRDKETGWYPMRYKHAAYDPEQKGSPVLTRAAGGEADGPMGMAAARENVPGITVSPRPGKMGGYPVREGTMDDRQPWNYAAEPGEHMPSPPPVQEPVYDSPRLERLHKLTAPIFKSKGFNDLVESLTGLRNLNIKPIHGMWMGEAEPSFHISHPDLTAEHVKKLAPLLGFGFQQDAVVHHHHNPDPVNEGAPTYYIGKKSKLTPEDMEKLEALSSREGIGYSTTNDGKGVKFSHFGDDGEEFDRFHNSVTNVANEMGFPHRHHIRTTSELQNAQDYLPAIFGSNEGDGGEGGLRGSAARSPDLFGRIVDHVLAPYAKAIASEGYRLSPERLAETYGLTPEETDKVRSALLPSGKIDRTTIPLMTGEEQLDVRPTGKGGKTNVGDVLFALQNRAARQGMISPTDYSKDAKEKIAGDVASEVKYHTDTAGKSAIGWYDSALKKAMGQYENHFPELKSDKSAQAVFKAILGITSQGQDVYQNSGHTVRAYDLLRKGIDLPDVVKQLRGTFGDKTRAIENNLLKLHDVAQKVGGYDALGGALNKKMAVSEWNKLLRQNPDFHFNGAPLQVKGGANQKVTGWSVFGPKIGSFINNLNGDYSTLTADLWFSRTWNRLLGHNFDHAPAQEAKQYRDFRDALLAEHAHHNPGEALPEASPHKTVSGKVSTDSNGNPQPWMHGNDVGSISRDVMDKLVNDPDKMLSMAQQLEGDFRKGGYRQKSDLRRRAKNWIENRENSVAAPRSDSEREFQQSTVERAQKMLKNQGLNISIADIQAALWFHEKDLFNKLGVASEKAKPADYADAATKTLADYVSRNKNARPKKYIGGALVKPAAAHVPTDAAQKALLIARKMRYG
jgi:hypothetical protein